MEYSLNQLIKEKGFTLYDLAFAKKQKQYNNEGEEITSFYNSTLSFEAFKIISSKEHRNMSKKYDMKKRIIKRVNGMCEPYFVTLTLSEEAMEKNFELNIRRIFKKYNILNWCLVEDYGEKNGRLHYHGYIDLFNVDLTLFSSLDSKKYDGFCFEPYKRLFGFNMFTKMNTKDLTNTINYTLKYITKDLDLKFEHKMFCSRSKKNKLSSEEEALKDLPF